MVPKRDHTQGTGVGGGGGAARPPLIPAFASLTRGVAAPLETRSNRHAGASPADVLCPSPRQRDPLAMLHSVAVVYKRRPNLRSGLSARPSSPPNFTEPRELAPAFGVRTLRQSIERAAKQAMECGDAETRELAE